MRLMAEMPVNAAARELREHDARMWRIFHTTWTMPCRSWIFQP